MTNIKQENLRQINPGHAQINIAQTSISSSSTPQPQPPQHIPKTNALTNPADDSPFERRTNLEKVNQSLTNKAV
jgi:hypothetical protein